MQNIQFVKHKDIDKMKWDVRVAIASNGLIYACSYYLDVMSENWDALIMDDYEAVMPLTWNKKFGISYLRQPPFTQQLGIFGSANFDKKLTGQFIKKALERYPFIDINLNYANDCIAHSTKKCNLVLSLERHFDLLKTSFRKDLVSKATVAHLIYESSEDFEEAIRIFKQAYSEKLPNLEKYHYENLVKLCILLKNKNQIFVRKVNSPEGKLLAMAIFFKDQKRIYYILSSLLPAGRKYDANAFLLYEVIKEFSGQNLIFDFEGSDIPSIKFFFNKFNPAEETYCSIEINTLPFWKKWIKSGYDHFKRSRLGRD
ncbi:MAG: GNAT family N-acetyltransferase [Ginsengibacter sp.]